MNVRHLRRTLGAGLVGVLALMQEGRASDPKPVLIYSRYFNAEGEYRYLPDGTFKGVMDRLRRDFEVRIQNELPTPANLKDAKLVLIANPSDRAVEGHPPPPHVTGAAARTLADFVRGGGGLILMGNQEDHNLEVTDVNGLLGEFGLQFTNVYTDAKRLTLPPETPVLGGLRWAYYTGNRVLIDPSHPARPRALVMNDLEQRPVAGTRDQAGCLLGVAEPGAGRIAVVTDSGWITDMALNGEGIGGVAIRENDNWEIFRRLARWTAGLPAGNR